MTMKFKFELDVQHAGMVLDALTAVHWWRRLLWRSAMKTITLAIAMSLACSAALAQAQQQSFTTERSTPDGGLVTTRSDGSMTEMTARREEDGAMTYTTTYPPGPPGMSATAPAAPATPAQRGIWTGYEGSPRDRAWVESCKPRIVTDREGIDRYVYAKRGCE